MALDEQRATDFKRNQRVRIVGSTTAPRAKGREGAVGEPCAKYQHRVAVKLYDEPDEIYFYPSELERLGD